MLEILLVSVEEGGFHKLCTNSGLGVDGGLFFWSWVFHENVVAQRTFVFGARIFKDLDNGGASL